MRIRHHRNTIAGIVVVWLITQAMFFFAGFGNQPGFLVFYPSLIIALMLGLAGIFIGVRLFVTIIDDNLPNLPGNTRYKKEGP